MQRLKITRREDLARRIGYSRTSLYTFEAGLDKPSDRFLMALEALENRAASAEVQLSLMEDAAGDDPVARLLRGLDFNGLCSVMESGVAQLRASGRAVPEALAQVAQAVAELRSRPPTGQRISYFPKTKADKSDV